MNGETLIKIDRAGYQGPWGEFCQENYPFLPDGELERIEKELNKNGIATHTAHTAGQFVIEIVK